MRHAQPLSRPTAKMLLSRGQMILLTAMALGLLIGLVFFRHQTGVGLTAATLIFTLLSIGFLNAYWFFSVRYKIPQYQTVQPDDPDLPPYSILLPLYKEGRMLRSLVAAIDGLHYPKDRLQVFVLLEENDTETQAEAVGLEMPAYFEVLIVPDDYRGEPKGKPRALNYGLERVNGVFTAIYDAEDRPEKDQLLKAVAAFRELPPDIGCVQARLNFWNRDSSWVTWMYWVEYVVHFDWVLPGIAQLGLIPPLGGTSNHLRTSALHSVGGWDSYNVTEDADLAAALAVRGYHIRMIDSVTDEEATAKLKVAIGQRRRWLKGYAITGFAYSRRPIRTARRLGPLRWLAFVLLMFGAPINALLSLLYWALTIDYIVAQSTFIEQLFPLVLFYIGLGLLVGGNMLSYFQMIFACTKRDGLPGVRTVILCGFFWVLLRGWTTVLVVIELCRPSKWHVWIKTEHGHDLEREQQRASLDGINEPQSSIQLDAM